MIRMTSALPRFLYSFLVALSCLLVSGDLLANSCERPAQLRFSLVPQGDVAKDIADLQPLFRNLERALKMPVVAITPSSYGAVVEGLLSGAVDLARLGPAAYVAAKKQDPAITAFATYARTADIFKQEGASYYSLLLTRSDDTYDNLSSLRGKTIALVDPDSTSGAVIPRRMVKRESGAPLEQFFGRAVYSGSHDKSIMLVTNSDVDAAFVSSSHVSTLVESGRVKLDDLKVLWRSGLIPRDPFVLRGQLCKDIQEKIRTVFLNQMGSNSQAVLKNLRATSFFPVKDSDYQIIRDAANP